MHQFIPVMQVKLVLEDQNQHKTGLYMLIALWEHKLWEPPVSHPGTLWAHEQSIMAEHPLYRCRGGWAAEELFQQVTEYFEINFLLAKDLGLKAKAKDLWTTSLMAKAKDLSLKAKVKDMPYSP